MIKSYRKPYRVKKKKSVLKSRLFWRVVLVLIFMGVSSYFFFLSSIFKIKEINISGNPAFAEATAGRQKILYQKIQKLLDTKNIFLIDFEEIKKEILEKFPQIASINIERKFPESITVQVEERRGVAIFCQIDSCFLIDKEGVIFENVSDKLGLVTIRPSLIESKRLGEKVLETSHMSSILNIESKLRGDFKIAVEEILAVSNERLNIETLEGWEIYFDPSKDLDWQITKLKAVLEQEISAEKRKNLEYIEL